MEYIINKIERTSREKINKVTNTTKIHKVKDYIVKAYKRDEEQKIEEYKKKKKYIVTAIKEDTESQGRFLDTLE